MQNRYVGDVGDFGKYGLLKKLCLPSGKTNNEDPELSLGIIWYLVTYEEDTGDGKYITYLCDSNKIGQTLRPCDEDLYEALKKIVIDGRRSVKSIKEDGILPSATIFYDKALTFDGMASIGQKAREDRLSCRKKWAEEAFEKTKDCDLVFVDPDNGLEIESVMRHHKKGPKYVFYSDLLPYIKPCQSLVIYHHINRQKQMTVEKQIKAKFEEINERFKKINKQFDGRNVFALLYRRGTSRAFFVIPADEHFDILLNRAKDLESIWKDHFSLHRP